MLSNWDPFREMVTMRRAMDRLIDRNLGEDQGEWGPAHLNVPMDITENEDAYLLKASLPGVDPNDIDITYREGVLTIQGQVREDHEDERDEYRVRERRFGSFTRSIRLPSAIHDDEIEASYQNGVLRLYLPKTEEVKPKRIQIKSGESQRMLEGEFTRNRNE
jgi:HSP20 family protein